MTADERASIANPSAPITTGSSPSTAASRLMESDAILLRRVTERYRACGRATEGYIRGKLRRDPVLRAVLALPYDFGDVLDLGCGRGQLGIALLEAGRARSVQGLDRNARHLGEAERAAAGLVTRPSLAFRALCRDLADGADIARADTVMMVDVLYQLETEAQLALLRAAAQAARERLLIRTLDPDRGVRSALTLAAERLVRRISPHSGARVNPLPIPLLAGVVKREGLAVNVLPCWQGTPFANVLLSARRLLPQRVDQGGDVVVVPREEGVVIAPHGEAETGALGDHVHDP